MSENNEVLKGYLYRYTQQNEQNAWQRFWFVLTSLQITAYRDERMSEKPISTILVRDILSAWSTEIPDTNRYAFKIESHDHILVLASQSIDKVNQWKLEISSLLSTNFPQKQGSESGRKEEKKIQGDFVKELKNGGKGFEDKGNKKAKSNFEERNGIKKQLKISRIYSDLYEPAPNEKGSQISKSTAESNEKMFQQDLEKEYRSSPEQTIYYFAKQLEFFKMEVQKMKQVYKKEGIELQKVDESEKREQKGFQLCAKESQQKLKEKVVEQNKEAKSQEKKEDLVKDEEEHALEKKEVSVHDKEDKKQRPRKLSNLQKKNNEDSKIKNRSECIECFRKNARSIKQRAQNLQKLTDRKKMSKINSRPKMNQNNGDKSEESYSKGYFEIKGEAVSSINSGMDNFSSYFEQSEELIFSGQEGFHNRFLKKEGFEGKQQSLKEKMIKVEKQDEHWKQFGNDVVDLMKKHQVENFQIKRDKNMLLIRNCSASKMLDKSNQSLDHQKRHSFLHRYYQLNSSSQENYN